MTTNESMRLERVLAAARVCVAGASLLVFWLHPVGATSRPGVPMWGMAGYFAYSVIVCLGLARRDDVGSRVAVLMHSVDLVYAVALALAALPVAVFSILLFVLCAVALRWQEERRRRTEAAAVTRFLAKVQPELGTTGSLECVFRELLRIFGARRLILVACEERRDRVLLWEVLATPGAAEPDLRTSELDPADQSDYLFSAPAQCWFAARDAGASGGLTFHTVGLDADGRRLPDATWTPPPKFLEAQPFETMLGVSLPFRDDGSDRLLLFDPANGARALSFFQRLVQQIGPAVYSVFLLGRLRARVGAAERARVARELHDGVIQALLGLEMKLEAWRRQPDSLGPAASRLEFVQRQVHEQVLSLRELMQQLKPLGIEPEQLVPYLADVVDRFRRETGIDARFSATTDGTTLPPAVCGEVARIVQEALMNIRRHSGARHALVTLGQHNGSYTLRIDDDGRGFGFSGRATQEELERTRRGPVVIKERVRAIDAVLSIDSEPGRGATLEIRIPRTGYD